MVESSDGPDDPPLFIWAKSKTPLPGPPPPGPPPSGTPTHPTNFQDRQDAGDISPAAAGPACPDTNAKHENTVQQDASAVDKKGDGTQPSTLGSTATQAPLFHRFIRDVKRIILCSWINWLLIFVPVGIIMGILVDWVHIDAISPSAVFAINAVAIIPLASLLAYATESVASKVGDTVGALMNVSFGNAVELIIFIIALAEGQVRVVQAAALGSILANLLLILGMAFVAGGLRYREQVGSYILSHFMAVLIAASFTIQRSPR